MTSRCRKTREEDRSTAEPRLQPPIFRSGSAPEAASQARANRRILGHDVLHLQRSLDNRAVAHLSAGFSPAAVQARRESVVEGVSLTAVQRRKGGVIDPRR